MSEELEHVHLPGSSPAIKKADLEEDRGWWERYRSALIAGGLTSTARRVLEVDCAYILDRGVLGAGAPGSPKWGPTRHRSGLVMGAVQSGKTASLLGVIAQSLDAGTEVVVVLAGTRLALWHQTYERLAAQLQLSDGDAVFPPARLMMDPDLGSLRPADAYHLPVVRGRRLVSQGKPLIFIVMKHGQHLSAAAKALHESVYPHFAQRPHPGHVLVIDDEADDGSILDALVENRLDPQTAMFKQIPRHVLDLWSLRHQAPSTPTPHVYATYVAYTATPQANFLQADVNPLSPRDFVASLRTPGAQGTEVPRGSSYREPVGGRAFYTGGEVFYGAVGEDAGLVVTSTASAPNQSADSSRVAAAVRAYAVAGAVRLWRDPAGRRPSHVVGRTFTSRQELDAAQPAVHSMLFHPSASVEGHFDAAAQVLAWGHNTTLDEARKLVDEGTREFHPPVLAAELRETPGLWQQWLDDYRRSAEAVSEALGEAPAAVPEVADWPSIEALLLEEVLPTIRLSVVNSDPDADDRPDFGPSVVGDLIHPPSDLMTIFISGNVMSRGLTLEGLCTTLFLRGADDPSADTQMQMQRWFGYRGGILELCRLFTTDQQRRLFSQYHELDEGLRQQVLAAMNETEEAPSPLVLEGAHFRATAKIAGVSKVPLSPGASPFIPFAHGGNAVDPNLLSLVDLFQQPSVEVEANDLVRGRILETPLSLTDAADLLDELVYLDYVPDSDDPLVRRWLSLEGQIGLSQEVSPLSPLFRGPTAGSSATPTAVSPRRCPYQLAAYLRLWAACLERSPRGLFPTGDGRIPWNRLDREVIVSSQPVFWVGLRFGAQAPGSSPSDPALLSRLPFDVPAVQRGVANGFLTSTWGSRNPKDAVGSYLGDQYFDYHHHHDTRRPEVSESGTVWRPSGAPALILFHVVQNAQPDEPFAAVGVSLPLGGPDHFAATTPSGA